QASAPRAVRDPMTSATLEKPLTRESLVHPDEHLSTPEGSGIFAARTPRLPRIHAKRANAAQNTPHPSKSMVALTRWWCQPEIADRWRSLSESYSCDRVDSDRD